METIKRYSWFDSPIILTLTETEVKTYIEAVRNLTAGNPVSDEGWDVYEKVSAQVDAGMRTIVGSTGKNPAKEGSPILTEVP